MKLIGPLSGARALKLGAPALILAACGGDLADPSAGDGSGGTDASGGDTGELVATGGARSGSRSGPPPRGSGGQSTVASGGSSSGGSASGGSTGSGLCDSVVKATGVPAMIDNFSNDSVFPNLPNDDGRIGTWEHEHSDGDGSSISEEPVLSAGSVNFSCDSGDWCTNTSYMGWGNFASLSTRLTVWSPDEVGCYDASAFTGIKFFARSNNGSDKIALNAISAEADPGLGYVYRSSTISLSSSWEAYNIPFTSFEMPSWVALQGGPSGSVNPAELISLSFIVRTVGGDLSTYEYVLPYDIEIDDISFY